MASTTTTATELRTLSASELAEKLAQAKEELFNLRFQAATGQLDSHGRLRLVRHDIARDQQGARGRAQSPPRSAAATRPLDSHGRLRSVRHDIARIYTVLRERELGIIGGTAEEETS